MMDGTSLAIAAAESLRDCTNADGDLYSRVCGHSPAEEQKEAEGRGEQGGAKSKEKGKRIQA